MEKKYVPLQELQKEELEKIKNMLITMGKVESSDEAELTPKLVVEHINNLEKDIPSTKSASIKLLIVAAITASICAVATLVNPTTDIETILTAIIIALSVLITGLSLGKAIVSFFEISQIKDFINEAIKYIKIYNPDLLKEIYGISRVKK